MIRGVRTHQSLPLCNDERTAPKAARGVTQERLLVRCVHTQFFFLLNKIRQRKRSPAEFIFDAILLFGYYQLVINNKA